MRIRDSLVMMITPLRSLSRNDGALADMSVGGGRCWEVWKDREQGEIRLLLECRSLRGGRGFLHKKYRGTHLVVFFGFWVSG